MRRALLYAWMLTGICVASAIAAILLAGCSTLANNNPVLNNVRSDQGVHIPARGLGDVHLTGHVTYDNIRSIWREVQDVIQGNRASYALRGNAYYDTPVGRLQFPVTLYSR